MNNQQSFEFVEFDFDAVWAALSKSSKLKSYLKEVAEDVASQAQSIARSEAYDEGYYSDLFKGDAYSAAEVRRYFNETWQKRRNRRRRGQEGTNRILDRPTVKGEDGKPVKIKGSRDGSEYIGSVGLVQNLDYKAYWIEYGSLADNPKFILSRASESVANKNQAEWEVSYNKTNTENRTQLNQKISEGKRNSQGKLRKR